MPFNCMTSFKDRPAAVLAAVNALQIFAHSRLTRDSVMAFMDYILLTPLSCCQSYDSLTSQLIDLDSHPPQQRATEDGCASATSTSY